MNFVAAMILMHCSDEALACQIFVKLLAKDDWVRMYIISSNPKLFDVCTLIMERIQKEHPALHKHLTDNEICLEIILAGPLMTLFANTLNFTESTHILNMFMLEGQNFIVDLIVNCYKNMAGEVLKLKDSFEIQAYLTKDIFEQAIDAGMFY